MKRMIAALSLILATAAAHALQPYTAGDKLAGGDLKAVMAVAEQKLAAAGFMVIGRHTPKGLPRFGTVVVTDATLSDVLKRIGGSAVIGAPIRVGV